MLLLADHVAHPLGEVPGEGLLRVLQVALAPGGGDRGHRRRQVGEQPRVQREAAHHLQRGGGVLLLHRHPAVVGGLHTAAAVDVGERQRASLARAGGVRDQRARRLVPDLLGRDGHQLPLGVAQRGHGPTEDATGVQADGVVVEGGDGCGGVPVDDQGPAPVVVGPRVAHREAELVGLAGGVAVQGVRADPARGPAVVLLRQAGVADHQPSAVEQVVADKTVHEGAHLGDELRCFGGQLVQ